jgi:ABC-type lipoprotein release transport system permease subunit
VPDYFMLTVALRHLRHGWGQSLLSLGLVTISVVVLILLAAVLGGVREKQVSAVTGAQPQVILERAERKPIAAWELPAGPGAPLYVGQTVDLPRSQNKIEDWRGWIDFLDRGAGRERAGVHVARRPSREPARLRCRPGAPEPDHRLRG